MLGFRRLVCNKFPAQSHVYKRHAVLYVQYGPGKTGSRKLDIQTDPVTMLSYFSEKNTTIQLAKTKEKIQQ